MADAILLPPDPAQLMAVTRRLIPWEKVKRPIPLVRADHFPNVKASEFARVQSELRRLGGGILQLTDPQGLSGLRSHLGNLAGMFVLGADGAPLMALMSHASHDGFMHEVGHFEHWRKLKEKVMGDISRGTDTERELNARIIAYGFLSVNVRAAEATAVHAQLPAWNEQFLSTLPTSRDLSFRVVRFFSPRTVDRYFFYRWEVMMNASFSFLAYPYLEQMRRRLEEVGTPLARSGEDAHAENLIDAHQLGIQLKSFRASAIEWERSLAEATQDSRDKQFHVAAIRVLEERKIHQWLYMLDLMGFPNRDEIVRVMNEAAE